MLLGEIYQQDYNGNKYSGMKKIYSGFNPHKNLMPTIAAFIFGEVLGLLIGAVLGTQLTGSNRLGEAVCEQFISIF